MPRNSSGSMSPANGPYTSGTTISSTAINARFADEEAELSDSLSRSGKGGMTAPLRTANGTVAAPSYSYTSDTGTGQYLAAAGDLRLAVGGVDALKLASGGVAGPVNMPSAAGVTATGTDSPVTLTGNLSATNLNGDVVITSAATRTAGVLLDVQNHGVGKLHVDYLGLLSLVAPAAAIQPASIWTTITPNTNIAASRGLAYTKDAVGKVHIRGVVTNNTGGNVFNINSSNPLPAGFRPASQRDFATPQGNVNVDSSGVINFFVAFPAGASASLDVISFFAEA